MDSLIHVQNRNILLYGRLRPCEQFYLQFSRYLSIESIITDYETECVENKEDTVCPIHYIKDWTEYDKSTNYIICCCTEREDRAAYDAVLERKGFFYGEDYIDAVHVLSIFRHHFKVDWFDKETWIFGAGDKGINFYKRYQDTGIKIGGFLSNFEQETVCEGLPVIQPAVLANIAKKNIYVVICSDAWRILAEQLEGMGVESFKDYCFSDWVPKKVFVAMGPCNIYHPSRMLFQNSRFRALYYRLLIIDTLDYCCSLADKKRFSAYGNICDAVFYRIKRLGDDEATDYGQEIVERYYPNAKKIKMPLYYFFGQLLQATTAINPYTVKVKQQDTFWFRGDSEVNKWVEAELSISQIIDKVSDESYWDKNYILENLKKEFHKIRVLDRLSSVKIADFVEKHYRDFILFRDGTHYSIELALHIANKILKMLAIRPFSAEEAENVIAETTSEQKSFMPLYPCVAKALQMESKESADAYPIVKSDRSTEWVCFKEYIRRYAEFAYSVKGIVSEYGSIF